MSDPADRLLATALASSFLDGAWRRSDLVVRGADVLGIRARWLPALVRDVLAAYHRAPRDRPRELARFVEIAPAFVRAAESARRHERPLPRPRHLAVPPTRMLASRWPVVRLDDAGALADLLGLHMTELDWFADVRGMQRRAPDGPLHHYRYRWLPTRHGARLLEAPRPRLRGMQRLVLEQVLSPIPVHDAVHGFVAGRCAVSGARLHVRSAVVVSLDLESFFACVTAARVYGVLRSAGYPEPVAHLLTGLCTNAAPVRVLAAMPARMDAGAAWRLRRRLATPHLPQGAPTSPYLANLCTYALDRRLQAYADRIGAVYTRYADDLVLSGGPGVSRAARTLVSAMSEMARQEGFRLNPHKTRVQAAADRQTVTGIVVNRRPNVPRGDYDQLKAILHNAVRDGPAGQNRGGHPDFRAHLLGRIAWVCAVSPERGGRLRAAFDRIAW